MVGSLQVHACHNNTFCWVCPIDNLHTKQNPVKPKVENRLITCIKKGWQPQTKGPTLFTPIPSKIRHVIRQTNKSTTHKVLTLFTPAPSKIRDYRTNKQTNKQTSKHTSIQLNKQTMATKNKVLTLFTPAPSKIRRYPTNKQISH